jgi:Tfp pilus assembly protein PilX
MREQMKIHRTASFSDRRDQRGMALAIVLLSLLVLTTLAATMIFVTQTEIRTSSNYQLVTQARYAAEAGAQRAANWIVYTYTPPSSFTSYDMTKYPVQYSGKPVVLSANNSISSNYPDASVQQAFSNALLNQPVTGAGVNATTAVTATLLSMQPAAVLQNPAGGAIQNWQITSQGSISGIQSVQVQVVTQIQNSAGNTIFTGGGCSTSSACNSFVISGNAKFDSFDSSVGAYIGTQQNSQGNIGSNGSIIVNSSGVRIYGNVVAAALTSLSCLLQSVLGLVNNITGQLTGSFSQNTQPVTMPTPPALSPAPPTTAANLVTSCASISGCSTTNGGLGPFTLTPGSYGNISVSGGKTVHLTAGTYTVNSFTLSGGSTVVVDSGPVIINIAGNSLAPAGLALDFGAGNISNTTGVPANLQVIYGGSHPISISGAAGASLVLDAPNAQLTLTGGGDLYGAFIALTIDDTSGSSVHYDRSLVNLVNTMGSYHTTAFSWTKF